MLLAQLKSMWTAEQILLTGAMVGAGALLALHVPLSIPSRAQRQSRRGGTKRRATHMARPPRVSAAPSNKPGARTVPIAFVVALSLVALLLLTRIRHPVGVRTDSWSDANVIVSGDNYARHGLFSNYGVALHQVTTDTNPPDPLYLYCQYPVVPNLINGLQQAIGIRSPAAWRLLPAACSLVSVLLWLAVFRRYTTGARPALAAGVMVTSYGFLAYADNLHFHAYASGTLAGAVWMLARIFDHDETRRRRCFLGCALMIFLTALFTWEYHLWWIVFLVGLAVFFRCPFPRPWLGLLIVPLFVAFGLQTAQRRLAFGDEPTSKGGFVEDVYRRTVGFDVAVDTPTIDTSKGKRRLTLGGYPAHLARRVYMFYGIPLLGFLAVAALLFVRQRRFMFHPRDWPPELKLLAALLPASVAWWLVLMQHTSVHPHTMRQALPAYALVLALAWGRCASALRRTTGSLLGGIGGVVLGVALLYPHVEGFVYNVRLHIRSGPLAMKTSRGVWGDFSRERHTQGFAESADFSRLRDAVPEGGVIFTNHNRLPPMRLWSQRPVYSAGLWRFPPDDPQHGRVMLEMCVNHLRDLYRDRPVPVYYVYRFRTADYAALWNGDPLLRLLLTGDASANNLLPRWRDAQHILEIALRTGSNAESFCRITATGRSWICCDLTPVFDALKRQYAAKGFPTRADFGPPR